MRNKVGLTPDLKETHVIKGTRIELKQLQLSGRTIFWGIRCEEADTVPPKKLERPNRGEVHKFKISKSESLIDIDNSKEI